MTEHLDKSVVAHILAVREEAKKHSASSGQSPDGYFSVKEYLAVVTVEENSKVKGGEELFEMTEGAAQRELKKAVERGELELLKIGRYNYFKKVEV